MAYDKRKLPNYFLQQEPYNIHINIASVAFKRALAPVGWGVSIPELVCTHPRCPQLPDEPWEGSPHTPGAFLRSWVEAHAGWLQSTAPFPKGLELKELTAHYLGTWKKCWRWQARACLSHQSYFTDPEFGVIHSHKYLLMTLAQRVGLDTPGQKEHALRCLTAGVSHREGKVS